MTDWNRFRQCPVCKAATGEPCVSISGTRVTTAGKAHSSRQLRTGYGRTGGNRG